MQLYCKTIGDALSVLAVHPDGDTTAPSAYGEGVTVLPYTGPIPVGDLIGRPAPAIDLLAYAAAKRYEVETGGISLNGARIDTGAGSQAKIGNAYALMQASGATSVEFKTQDGFVTLSADQFKLLAIAVGQHVQACYAKEADVVGGITAKKPTIKTIADVDQAFAGLAG